MFAAGAMSRSHRPAAGFSPTVMPSTVGRGWRHITTTSKYTGLSFMRLR
jgi:hypothetical protein